MKNPFLLAILIIAVISLITLAIAKTGNSSQKAEDEKTKVTESVSETVLSISDIDFSEKISTGVVLVDYWAVWCMPCRLQAPILEKVAQEMSGKAKIYKLDVDKNQVTSAKYGIVSIPTIIIFKDGKKVETLVGLQNKESLIQSLNKHIK